MLNMLSWCNIKLEISYRHEINTVTRSMFIVYYFLEIDKLYITISMFVVLIISISNIFACVSICIDTFIGHVKFLNKELLCNGHGNIIVENQFEISCHF